MSNKITANSLVIYRGSPAKVTATGDKFELDLKNGKTVKVRDKDIQLLHSGPFNHFGELGIIEGDIDGAYELIEGETVSLEELADLIYGEFSPQTAWNTWIVLQKGLYFTGDMDAISGRPIEEIEKIKQAEEEKRQAQQAWEDYLQRVKTGSILPEDSKYLQDIERLAYGNTSSNQTLRELSIPQSREKAHELLMKLNFWPETTNPYPQRFNLPTNSPNHLQVPDIPEEERLDLTHLDSFAIDDDGARDPDDAISIDGDFLWVHVADAAALVPADSELDIEARDRGANLYLPELTANMLPEKVTDALGLGLHDMSPALSVKIKLSDDGEATCEQVIPTTIKVTRLSYNEADTKMTESPFADIAIITNKFQEKRIKNGAANLDLPEVKIRVENDDIKIIPLPSLKSREMVTNAMLMAGEAIAKFAEANEIAIPYSTQVPPETIETPETMAEMFAYRKQFKRTEQHMAPAQHFSLGLTEYTRFTSPLRRYSDLIVHQQIRAFITKQQIMDEDTVLKRISEADTNAASNAQTERQSNRHWTLLYLKRQQDWQSTATVVDKRDNRGVVMIPELGMDVKVRNLDKYNLDDKVTVSLNNINLPELDVYLQVTGQ